MIKTYKHSTTGARRMSDSRHSQFEIEHRSQCAFRSTISDSGNVAPPLQTQSLARELADSCRDLTYHRRGVGNLQRIDESDLQSLIAASDEICNILIYNNTYRYFVIRQQISDRVASAEVSAWQITGRKLPDESSVPGGSQSQTLTAAKRLL